MPSSRPRDPSEHGGFFTSVTHSSPVEEPMEVLARAGQRRTALLGGAMAVLVLPSIAFAQAAAPEAPKLDAIAKAVADNATAINFVWVLVAGFLVMFMQAGFALVETGFTRAKNAGHTITMNFMVYGIAMIAYWAI